MNVGGNKFLLWVGNTLVSIGNSLVANNKAKVVTNITYDFVNPFTLVLSFVVDSTEKYQILLQGDYKDKYIEYSKSKNSSEDVTVLNQDQLENLVLVNKSKWFRKF
jgi:hypothetical protein